MAQYLVVSYKFSQLGIGRRTNPLRPPYLDEGTGQLLSVDDLHLRDVTWGYQIRCPPPRMDLMCTGEGAGRTSGDGRVSLAS